MAEGMSSDRRLFKEVSIVLVIKVLLLICLWYAFFSSPGGGNIDAERVSVHIAGPIVH